MTRAALALIAVNLVALAVLVLLLDLLAQVGGWWVLLPLIPAGLILGRAVLHVAGGGQ